MNIHDYLEKRALAQPLIGAYAGAKHSDDSTRGALGGALGGLAGGFAGMAGASIPAAVLAGLVSKDKIPDRRHAKVMAAGLAAGIPASLVASYYGGKAGGKHLDRQGKKKKMHRDMERKIRNEMKKTAQVFAIEMFEKRAASKFTRGVKRRLGKSKILRKIDDAMIHREQNPGFRRMSDSDKQKLMYDTLFWPHTLARKAKKGLKRMDPRPKPGGRK